LTPASARQNHTTCPSVTMLHVFQHRHVHRIPGPRIVTLAKRPSATGLDAADDASDFRKCQTRLRATD
jgi:hypothetical protein